MKENYVYPAKVSKLHESYCIKFIDFPDICIAEGESREEAIRNAQELLALEIMDYESRKCALPSPSEDELNVIYIHIWMPYFRNITKKVYVKKNVTIPQWLDIMAKEKKINYSAALVKGLESALGIDRKF